MQRFAAQVSEMRLFPTVVLSLQFENVEALNEEIYRFFSEHEAFQADDYLQHGDAENLLDQEKRCPALGRLRDMFVEGFEKWMKAEGFNDTARVDMYMFSNFARMGEYTLIHNHNTHVAAVYYVRVPSPPAVPATRNDANESLYWAQDNGVLVLHDPRFNANLASVQKVFSEKIHPKSGQMVLFPGYLWHSVTPNRDAFRRLSIACNFYVELEESATPHSFRLSPPHE